jgi:hypothetical protein
VVTIESDPLAHVTELVVHYRQAGQGAYSIGRGPASASVVEVPAAFLAGLKGGTRVEYYIEALDGLEGELVALGSPREPFVFAVAGAPLGETAPGPGPSGSAWYKKWWVWTVAGAVVAGAATGAYFGTRTAPYNPPGVHVPMP